MTILKSIPILCILTLPFFLVGCSPPVVEEVSTGITEGVILEIEDTRL